MSSAPWVRCLDEGSLFGIGRIVKHKQFLYHLAWSSGSKMRKFNGRSWGRVSDMNMVKICGNNTMHCQWLHIERIDYHDNHCDLLNSHIMKTAFGDDGFLPSQLMVSLHHNKIIFFILGKIRLCRVMFRWWMAMGWIGSIFCVIEFFVAYPYLLWWLILQTHGNVEYLFTKFYQLQCIKYQFLLQCNFCESV